eukprot:scaffold291799_cov21-Tisochrysis_lutea.AAC.1
MEMLPSTIDSLETCQYQHGSSKQQALIDSRRREQRIFNTFQHTVGFTMHTNCNACTAESEQYAANMEAAISKDS